MNHPEPDALLRNRLKVVTRGTVDRYYVDHFIGTELDKLAAKHGLIRHPAVTPFDALVDMPPAFVPLPKPREMVLDDICPATMEYPWGVWHRTWPASQWDFDRAFK